MKALAGSAKKLRHNDPIFHWNTLLTSQLALLHPPRQRKCLTVPAPTRTLYEPLFALSIRYPDTECLKK